MTHVVDTEAMRVLTFHVGRTRFAVPILEVREIVGMMDVTPVPDTPPGVLGVINLRGRVIPVVDSRHRLGLEPREVDERACIVVFEVHEQLVGAVVDDVSDVVDVPRDALDPPPPSSGDAGRPVRALARLEDGVTILLDPAGLLDCSSGSGRDASTDEACAGAPAAGVSGATGERTQGEEETP